MPMSHFLTELIVGSGAAGVMTVVGYFLKKQNDKIDSVDTKLVKLSKDVAGEMRMTKKEVVSLFHDICHERQDSCMRLMTTKLESVSKQQDVIVAKLDALQFDRNTAWQRQDNINDAIKAHIAKFDRDIDDRDARNRGYRREKKEE